VEGGADLSESCQDCVAGRYQPVTGADHESLCLPCEAGKTASDKGRTVDCLSCPSGWFMDLPAQTTECKPCQSGYAQKNESSITCEPCLPGFYQGLMSQNSCSRCDPGTYSQSLMAKNCKNCDRGQHQDKPAGSMCFVCMPGYTAPSAGARYCTACEAGKFMNVSEAKSDCHSCASGKYEDQTGSFTCKSCLVGQYQKFENQVSCDPCPRGYFQNFPAETKCDFCPTGFIQKQQEKTQCIMCLAGQFEPNTASVDDCKKCPEGYVQPLTEQSDCVKCLAGKTSTKPAQTVCSVCPAGRIEPGNGSTRACNKCDLHTYTELEGQSKCLLCPTGFKKASKGGTECELCGAGKYGAPKDIRKNTTDGSCLLCPEGKYRSGNISEPVTTCISCPEGYHQPAQGSASCLPCIPGRYNNQINQISCTECSVNYFAPEISLTSCTYCLPGTFTNKRSASASCQPCPAGTAGSGCALCELGMYRGNTDDEKTCLKCKKGKHASDLGSPFCLDCDAGKYADVEGLEICIHCAPGRYQSEKRAKLPCDVCLNDLVPNEKQTACEVVPVDPNAAIAQLVSIQAASKDAKSLNLTYELSKPPESDSISVIRSRDKLEVQSSLRTDFKYIYKTRFFAVPSASQLSSGSSSSSVLFSFIVDPPSSTTSNDELIEIPKYGSVWNQLLYFRVRIVNEEGGRVRRGSFSTRNDAYTIASVCGDHGYLQTHKNNNLSESPLSIFLAKNTNEEDVPNCKVCPEGANCRGARTFSQVVPLDGYRVLPWDVSAYGKCPRPDACIGNDLTLDLPELKFEEDGGNSTLTVLPCHSAHQGILCGECKYYHDTAIGDPLGVCFPCPDETENLLKIIGIGIAAAAMLAFLVLDSLDGVEKIVVDHIDGEDAAVPFHSVGFRIISSFMQIAGLLNNFRLDLPAPIVSLMTTQSSVSGVGGSSLSFNCMLPETRGHELFMTKLIFIIIVIPIGLSLCVCVFWVVVVIVKKVCRSKADNHGVTPFDKAVGSIVIMYYIMFPSILNGMTDAMSCTTYGPKQSETARVLLDGSLETICYQNKHLMILVTIVVPSFVLFVCITPLVIVFSMRIHHKDLSLLPHQKNFNPVACYRFGFLFLGYEEEWYGWELLVMMRKATFVVVTGLLRPYGPISQVTGAITILFVALSVHLQHRPYDSDGHDIMESVSLHMSLIILMSTLLCSMVGRTLDGKLGTISTIILILLVFISTITFFGVALVHICKHSHDHDGPLGMIARALTKKTHNDRRHSIHRLHMPRFKRGMSGHIPIAPHKVIPSRKDIGSDEEKAEENRVLKPTEVKNWTTKTGEEAKETKETTNDTSEKKTENTERKKENDIKRRESRRHDVRGTNRTAHAII
jgi:flagellar basal body-associated protein FliL